MGKEKKQVEYTSEYELEGRIPLGRAILLGMQHVLAMFVGNLTPILIIGGMCGLADAGLMRSVLQNAMLIAGIVTLIQLWTIGPGWLKVTDCNGNKFRVYRCFKRNCCFMRRRRFSLWSDYGSLFNWRSDGRCSGILLKTIKKVFPGIGNRYSCNSDWAFSYQCWN